nr:TPA_asm: m90 uORF RNA *1 [Murid betaherpesvirus 1]DBA08038.1 TPA_asm: m90 uORF RNA *1 [Murid betaherpesvirus 1]
MKPSETTSPIHSAAT